MGKFSMACLFVAAWCFRSAIGYAAPFDESVCGDLSDAPASPTPWTLTLGANALSGRAGADFNANAFDYDLVAFTVQPGHQLDSIDAVLYENETEFAAAFLGLQAGSPWLDDVGNFFGTYLMGWAHLDTWMIGSDVLVEIQSHASDPVFDVPLASGVYTLLIQDIDTVFDYSLVFNVSAVPEPASGLIAVGAMLVCWGVKRMASARTPCNPSRG